MTKLRLQREPFDYELDFPREVERFLSRPFARFREFLTEEWFPFVNIAETKEELIVKAEVPGMAKEDISISLSDNVLTLRGEKKKVKAVYKDGILEITLPKSDQVKSKEIPILVED